MFESWGRLIYRHRKLTLLLGLVVVAFMALFGPGVFSRVQASGGFTAPGSQSDRAASLATRAFGHDSADVVVLYSSPTLTVRDQAFHTAVIGTLAALPRSDVSSIRSYWSTGSTQFVSASGHKTYVTLGLTHGTASFDAIKNRLAAPGLTERAGGQVPTVEEINRQVKADAGRAEAISLPVLLVLMAVIFGSVAAAGLPLAIGGIGILGSFTVLRLLTLATDVSTYAINITTILGLGLAIDYGLFMVSRFREELRGQPSVADAVARTTATAGRTVAVSGITVAAALASLMIFPEMFLRSMGYGGVATVAVDVLAATTVMPALLAVLGPRVNALRIRGSVHRAKAENSGGWYRLARSVMRRPVLYVVGVVALLVLLGLPFLRVSWGGTDARALPANSAPHVVTQTLERDFAGNAASPIEPIIRFASPVTASPAERAVLAGYVSRLSHVPGVDAARVTGLSHDLARIDVSYRPQPDSVAARNIVARVRALAPPPGATVLVGGVTAAQVDVLASLGHVLPWMAAEIAVATFALLFLAFGSVVLPVKAIVLNVMSLSATFGAIVWIFQWGHLSGLLGFTPTGTIDPTMPILMFAIIFGLSMDYEVFLLSRIRERYDLTRDNTGAVADGLQRTGGIITSLALMLVVVTGAFSTSGISFIKLLGVGMIVALVVDAAIVRVLLVPAAMRLLGQMNWWAPRPLRRLTTRYAIGETEPAGKLGLCQDFPVDGAHLSQSNADVGLA